MKLTSVSIAASLFAAQAFGQEPIGPGKPSKAGWENVRTLATGSEIEARTTDNKRYLGRFEAAEDDALVVVNTNGEQRLARAIISRVSVKKPGHRLRHTLMGLGIGAAAGIALGAVADARCTGKCIEGKTPLGKEAGTGIGALIGTIAGVASPGGSWREVYRAP